MFYATSDLHGVPLEWLLRLLDKAGFSDNDILFVLGDVADRNGHGGISIFKWMIENPQVEFILGNHEDMMLKCEFLFSNDPLLFAHMTKQNEKDLEQWLRNGAEKTIMTLEGMNPDDRDEIFKYLKNAPLYKEVSVEERRLVLVHAGLGGFNPIRKLNDYTRKELIWHRPNIDEYYFNDRTVILGHTPTQYYGIKDGKMLKTESWIDIDTGAASGGKPMLLRLNDMKEYYC